MTALTRRDALAAALAAGGAAAFPAAARADQKDELEKAVLAAAMQAVQSTAVAYEALANSGRLGSVVETTLRTFLEQENEHARAVETFLDNRDAKPPPRPLRSDVPGLERVRGDRQALALARGLEARTCRAWLRIVREVEDAIVVKTAAGMLGCDAQQLVVLRQLADVPAVPDAFETGAAG